MSLASPAPACGIDLVQFGAVETLQQPQPKRAHKLVELGIEASMAICKVVEVAYRVAQADRLKIDIYDGSAGI